jgi:predicted nucleic acid-binding protein
MYKLRDQLEQILNEQDKLKADFEKAKSEYIKNSNLIALKREVLIAEEISNFFDKHYVCGEDFRSELDEFRINFESFINYDIHNLREILEAYGYIGLEYCTLTEEGYGYAKPYIKGFKPK